MGKEKFKTIYSFSCAVGVIDCTYISIKKIRGHGNQYINRKGYPPKINGLQAHGPDLFMMSEYGAIHKFNH